MNIPINIAYVDHTGELGGAEHLLLSLLSQLPQNKVTPFLFCGAEGPFSRQAHDLGIHTEIIRLPRFYSTSWVFGNQKILNPLAVIWNGISLFIAAWKLRRKIQAFQIDIVQTNTVLSHIYGGMAARSLKIPCVWYFHDLVETHRLFGFFTIIWRILAYIFPNWIVADSQAVLKNLSPGSHGKVIYPGVSDIDEKTCKAIPSLLNRLDLPDTSILVGSLGRIAYVKGLDVLIEAAQIVVQQNQNIHFILFGGALFGEDNYKTKLEEKVKQFGLTEHWHWMGYDEFAKEYLKECDFIVFPSRREAFGLACVEAGLAGKAVIAASVGGIPEIIENGKTGILVQPQNSQKLAIAIIELANDPEFVALLGKNAKIRMKKLFNIKRYIQDFLEFYETINY